MNRASELDKLFVAALEHAPFAALLFRPDHNLTLLWRNAAHVVMTRTPVLEFVGRGMFEVFQPNDKDDADAARVAIIDTVARICQTQKAEEIGPYRFDLLSSDGTYVEYHWQIVMSPVFTDGEISAILQVSQDVTDAVLSKRLSSSLTRAAGRTAAVSYFSFDPVTSRFIRGEGVDQMFGFEPGEAGDMAAPFFDRVHPDDLPAVNAEVERVFNAPQGDIAAFDYRVLLPDGSERFVRIRAEVAIDPDDRRAKLVGTFVDLTDVENTRRALVNAVEQREALVNEANHRIKNSLQIAIAVLRIEMRALAKANVATVEEAVARLNVVQTRIRAVADVHGLMQLSRDATVVSVAALLDKLVAFTRSAADLPDDALTTSFADGDLSVESSVAVNLGLIVNELLTNALKYGVERNGKSDIHVALGLTDQRATITVVNGVQNAPHFGTIGSTHVGSLLIGQLSQQIGAKIETTTTGSSYRVVVSFPMSDASRTATQLQVVPAYNACRRNPL